VPGFWLAGDTTWPGLGTVACALGSRIVAGKILALAGSLGTRERDGSRILRVPVVSPLALQEGQHVAKQRH
jgi:hypothetical protein